MPCLLTYGLHDGSIGSTYLHTQSVLVHDLNFSFYWESSAVTFIVPCLHYISCIRPKQRTERSSPFLTTYDQPIVSLNRFISDFVHSAVSPDCDGEGFTTLPTFICYKPSALHVLTCDSEQFWHQMQFLHWRVFTMPLTIFKITVTGVGSYI